ncbi:MAG: hypothetical protein K5986_12320 [Clostridium sp.]|nr:hypothetical protein [Clostridium sp.]
MLKNDFFNIKNWTINSEEELRKADAERKRMQLDSVPIEIPNENYTIRIAAFNDNELKVPSDAVSTDTMPVTATAGKKKVPYVLIVIAIVIHFIIIAAIIALIL